MNTMAAYAMGQANKGRDHMVFDWDKAAQLLRERNAIHASAGLSGDLEYTCGEILSDGKPDLDGYTYLSSNWATPVLVIDGEETDCYRMASEVPDWDSSTKWPPSALAILASLDAKE